MAGRTLSVTIPAWTANLLPNLLGLAGLATICVMVAFLTDWRWGGLLAGVIAVGLAWWISQPQAEVRPVAEVTPLKKAA